MPSKLEQLQQQYRRQLLQEKEERMIKIHTESQQRALTKVARYVGNNNNASSQQQPQHHASPVKKGSPGVDRSRPLPPISKNTYYNNNRTSPVSAPISPGENKAVSLHNSNRSKSVDLVDSRFGAPAKARNGYSNSKQSVDYEPPSSKTHNPARNGYSSIRAPESHPKQQSVDHEKRPDPETLAKMRQAELQRLRAKVRDETPPRSNGFTGAISKSSNNTVPKKTSPPAKPQPTAAAPARTRPSYQGGAPARRGVQQHQAAPPARGSQNQGRKPPGPGQEQCGVCGRNFNADRIAKHASICTKAAQKKVKVFDATKMRVKGTEAEQFVRKGLPKTEPKAKKSDWRKKHNEFVEAIRQAKMVQQHLAKGGKVSDLPPPPPSDTSDYVPCPYCGRKFSEGVAERHIPKCKNILSNKKNPVQQPRRK